MDLTPRQNQILLLIIEEYIDSCQPIGSVELVNKRGLNISGATVRNIMADLVKKGYLQMPHASSGRAPTERAYRYYITELMEEVPLSVLDELAIKQKIWTTRFELERMLKNTAVALSDTTGMIAFALTTDGYIAYSGASKVLDMPEFYEIDVAKAVFKFVDDYDLAISIVSQSQSESVTVFIGREIGLANMEPITIITAPCKIETNQCYIGLIGPSRTKYEKMIPIIKHTVNMLNEVGESL